MSQRNPELLRGAVELLIFAAVSHGPQHGFGVARWIEATTGAALQLEEGSLYPALHRMERRGWLAGKWGISDRNRQVKFYQLTPQGHQRLESETAGWTAFASAVSKVLATVPLPA